MRKADIDSLFMSDLDHSKLDILYLRDVRKEADDLGIDIHVGIDIAQPPPPSKTNGGPPRASPLIRVAKLGRRIRVILGNRDDRSTVGGTGSN